MKLQIKVNTNVNELLKLVDEAKDLSIKMKDVVEKINNFELRTVVEKGNTKEEADQELQLHDQPKYKQINIFYRDINFGSEKEIEKFEKLILHHLQKQSSQE